MYRASIMEKVIPRDGKISLQVTCNQLNRISICRRRKGNVVHLVFDHLLQELDLKMKGQGLSVLLFTAELNEIGAEEKEFFDYMFLLYVLI